MTMSQRVAGRYLAAVSGEAPIEKMVKAIETKLRAIGREPEVMFEDYSGKPTIVCSCRPKSVPMALEYAKHEGHSPAQIEKIKQKAISEMAAALKAAMTPFKDLVKEIEPPHWNEKDIFFAHIHLNVASASTPVEDIVEAVQRDVQSGLSAAGEANCYPYHGTNLSISFSPTGPMDAKGQKKAQALFKKVTTDALRPHKKWIQKVNPFRYQEHNSTFYLEVELKP